MVPGALLLLLPLLLSGSAQKVKVRSEVTGFVGHNVTLPCTFTPDNPDIKITQVTWVKEAGGKKTSVAVYNPVFGTSGTDKRITFLQASLQEPTLVIGSLAMADEGTYQCEFATYPTGNEEGTTKLTILVVPKNSAEAVPVTVGANRTAVAVCTSATGKPASEITWESPLAGVLNGTVTQHPNLTITTDSQYQIVPTSDSDGKTITCVITHQTASAPQRFPVTLSVQYPPEVTITGYDDNWYLNRQDANLQCDAKSNPKPSKYVWKTLDGQPLPNTVEAIGNLLQVKNVDLLLNTTLVCEVTNALGTRSSQLNVLVRERALPQQSDNAGAIVGGIIGTLLIIALVGVIVFFVLRSRKTKDKGSYTPNTRVFGNGATSQQITYHEDSDLGKPLQDAPRMIEETPRFHADEDDENQNFELLEDEDERFNEVGPMLQLRPQPHEGYIDDDMESQNDGSMISKTAVYV